MMLFVDFEHSWDISSGQEKWSLSISSKEREKEREEECVLVCERGGERELTKEQKEQASWFWEKTEV